MATAWSDHNVAMTVESRPRYETLRCTVRTEKAFPPAFVFDPSDPDYMSEEFLFHWYHVWSDGAGGLKGGACEKCGKTLKEVRVRINPKTSAPVRRSSMSLARAIAAPADVPPLV